MMPIWHTFPPGPGSILTAYSEKRWFKVVNFAYAFFIRHVVMS